MKLYGAIVLKITDRDEIGGCLGTIIKYIQSLVSTDSSYVWTHQYASQANIKSYFEETANEIYNEFVEWIIYL